MQANQTLREGLKQAIIAIESLQERVKDLEALIDSKKEGFQATFCQIVYSGQGEAICRVEHDNLGGIHRKQMALKHPLSVAR